MTHASPQSTGAASSSPSRHPSAWRSHWLRPLALVGLTIIAFWLIIAVFAQWLAPYDPLAQDFARLEPPSATHWLGTDSSGRDLLRRLLVGAQVSIPLALVLVVLSCLVGSVVGAVAGYFGKFVDSLVMRSADLVLAFPGIILAMAAAAAFGPSLTNAVLALVLVMWPTYARVVRSLALSLREVEFVSAARLFGSSSRRTLLIDVGPNVIGQIAVLAALEVGNAVLLLSGLSFLGLGAQAPQAEWGAMVSDGARNFDAWWIGLFPGLAILSIVLAFNFLGDSLRDAFDPRLTRAGKGRS
ncbi:ABC transporter permease [Microbacterium saperdae]